MIYRKSQKMLTVFFGLAGIAVVALVITAVMQQSSNTEVVPDGPTVTVYKNPNCRCCTYWTRHLEKAGFDVDVRVDSNRRDVQIEYGITEDVAACHTGVVDGYVIEGHVPAADIRRLLEDRPDAAGLAVPGMPVGSPGMPGPNPQPFDVLLLKENGSTDVFQRYVPKQ
ncbi:MAG: DUF411 domain-containing protein [Woeseiaceae bacterium]|nr:DUF411 domain-containing protein [Woeseiaceae bacterium]